MTDTALTELVISWLWLIAVCWLLLRAYRQSKLFTRLAPTRQVLGRNPDVSVLIPARNESANIARCALSILNQSYPAGCLRVIVVDDNSTDDTAAIAHSISKQRQELEVLHSPPLPAGWIGKSHACWFGSRQVSPHADWLCFIDADVWSEPELIATAVQYAAAE